MPDHPGLQGAHVELRDVGKSFGAARALEAVSLQIARGSIHALVGENGAGKSTLGKIVSGVIPPDHGEMLLGGEPVRFHSPREAIARGIVLIAQELSLVPALSVAENVFLGTEPRRAGFLRRAALRRRYAELAGSVGFELDGDAPAGRLRTADQQKVEILRALSRDAGLIVMDEPTAALSRPDAVRLHEIIRRLAGSGTTIVLVSHFLREVLDLAQEVTILRDGRVVRTAPRGRRDRAILAERDARPVAGRHIPGQAAGRRRGAGGALRRRPVRGRGEQRLAGGAGRRDRRAGRPGRRGPHRTRPRGAGGQPDHGGNRQRRRRARARQRSTGARRAAARDGRDPSGVPWPPGSR